MKNNTDANVRELANACIAFLRGEGVSRIFKIDPEYRKSVHNITKLAEDQRIMPIISSVLDGEQWKTAFKNCGITTNAYKGSIYYLSRNMTLRAQLKEIDEALRDTDIYPILLKGSIRLFDGLNPGLGMRHMEDIDFLTDDPELLKVLIKLGYTQKDGTIPQWTDPAGNFVHPVGGHHWDPLFRPENLVSLEPHFKAVSPRFEKWLPTNFSSELKPVSTCHNLRAPSHKNQLILCLLHLILHNRDSFVGGLHLRGIIESELMFERLTQEEKLEVEAHFSALGKPAFYNSWRALADWTLRNDNTALYRSVKAFLLITEFQLRSSGYSAVFILAFFHRFAAFFDHSFWSSGLVSKTSKRVFAPDFWSEAYARFKFAIGISTPKL